MMVQVSTWMAAVAVIDFFYRHTVPNQRALKSVEGYIVGNAARYDEREQVFALERTLLPDSAQYIQFYRMHPELEQMDPERRKASGLLGMPGAIDRPGKVFKISAMSADFSIPPYLGKPESHSPAVHATGDNCFSLSPEKATLRVMGITRHLGADALGLAKMNPLWVYSNRVEIFNNNWGQWGEEISVGHSYAIFVAMKVGPKMVRTTHPQCCGKRSSLFNRGLDFNPVDRI